jgi:predicted SAM-dependent methyltransferase
VRKIILIAGTINHHPDTEENRYVHLDGAERDIYDAELDLLVRPDVVADLHGALPMFRDAMFDSVVCDHVWEHLDGEQIISALHAIHRVLKVGGELVVETPNMSAIARAWIEKQYSEEELQQWIHGENVGGPYDAHRYSYSPESLRALIERGGFRIIQEIEKGLAIRFYAERKR